MKQIFGEMAKYTLIICGIVAAGALGILTGACDSSSVPGTNPPTSSSEDPRKDGNQIVAEYLKRDAAPYRKMQVRLTITSEDEPAKVFELETWRRQSPAETVTLTRIIKPAEDSDLASLAVESPGKDTVVTAYVASRNEFRETGTNKMFFGGLTAGELLGEWSKFDYRFLGSKVANGTTVNEVEAKLKTGMTSVASRMTILLREDDHLPLELRSYDAANRHLRTFSVREFGSDVKGPYAAKTEVENHIYRSRIVIEVLSREFPDKADDAIFTRERLKQIAGK